MGFSYQDLIAWQKAMDFAEEIYTATRGFPKDELYGLTSQLRTGRNIHTKQHRGREGRLTPGEFRQFLGHARGSLLETETQILMAGRLRYLSEEQVSRVLKLSAELGRVLNGLIASI
ncbi:MAG: four helix bundle protein [Candidatus Sulfotelmatobacter sp.]|jgi:four helix bundle protein